WRTLRPIAERRSRQAWLFLGVLSLIELCALGFKREHSAMGLPRQDVAAAVVWLLCAALALLTVFARRSTSVPGPRHMVGLAYVGGYLLLGAAGIAASARSHLRQERGPRAESLNAISQWIGDHASNSAVIMAQPFASLELATSRHVVPFPITSNPFVLRDAVARQRPGLLVVLDTESPAYFTPTEATRRAILDSVLGRPLEVRVRVSRGTIYGLPDSVTRSPR
ncbi:MAG: hypothetical protein ACJ8AD_10155, partial [Gemmatimonadaceae bacterium]